MKRLYLLLLCAVVLSAVPMAARDMTVPEPSSAVMTRRAALYFDLREWASANALYTLLLDQQPHDATLYGRAIATAAMMDDNDATATLMHDAMEHGVPFDSVFSNTYRAALDAGNADLYEHFLLQTRSNYPYLTRPINNYLMQYYDWRNNAPRMIQYATLMLQGNERSIATLSILARAYLLENRDTEAVDTWRRILEVDPTDRNALLSLAQYYAVRADASTTARNNALHYVQRAYALYPSPYLESTLHRLTAN